MKIFARTTIKFTVFLSLLFCFDQTVFSQENNCIEGMFFDEILSKFTMRRTISPEPVNKELIGEIPKRKIGFELNETKEKILRDAGANDSVIMLIDENILPEIRGSNSLYGEFSENYQSNNVEKLKAALDAAEEFIRKFENKNKECYIEFVKSYKEAVEMISLYIRFLSNYRSNYVDDLESALESAKEFVRKFEKNKEYAEQTKYFKEEAIPFLTDAVNSKTQYKISLEK